MASITAVGARGNHRFTLTVTETFVSSGAENYSNVSIAFAISPVHTSYDWAGWGNKIAYTLTVNGVNYTGTIPQYDGYSTKTLYTATQRINHDPNGTKTVAYSFAVTDNAKQTYTPGNASATGTMALTTIARYAAVTQLLQAKTETTLTVNWTTDAAIDAAWYSTDNGSTWTSISGATGTSGGYTVTGLTAGASYTVKTRVRRADSQLTSDSDALTVATYPWPYANVTPDFFVGDDATIGIFNPLGRSVTVNVTNTDGSQVILTDTTNGTTVNGFDDDTVVDLLMVETAHGGDFAYKVVTTYDGHSTTVTGGTISEKSQTIAISAASYENATAFSGITIPAGKVVQALSEIQYAVRREDIAPDNIYAEVVGVTVTVHGQTVTLEYDELLAAWTNTDTTGTEIDAEQDVVAVFTATDTRGATGTISVPVEILPWQLPTAIITLARKSNFYTASDLTVDADYSSVGGLNSVTIQYCTKKTTDANYGAWATISDNVTETFNADTLYEWNVQVKVTDAFGGTVTYNLTLPIGIPIVFFDRLLRSVGFNCFPVDQESVEIKGSPVQRNAITVSMAASLTNLTENAYDTILFDTSSAVGSKLTLSGNGVEIGSGVTAVKISGIVSFTSTAISGPRQVRVTVNNVSMIETSNRVAASQTGQVVIPPVIVSVSPGDVVYLQHYGLSASDVISAGLSTSLTVEVLA